MKPTIIILHGWGLTGKRYSGLAKLFKEKNYPVFTPTMPGFGDKKLTKPVMVLSDYVAYIKEFMSKQKIKQAIFVGHSFGGRVAIKFATHCPDMVLKLIIVGSPLIKQSLSIKKKLAKIVAKVGKYSTLFLPGFGKQFLKKVLYFSIGEWDYYHAGDLRETFKKIIAEDLSSLLPKISVPTLLVWGKNEAVVPVKIGREISARIPKAKFIVLPNTTHKLPYENPYVLFASILKFIS